MTAPPSPEDQLATIVRRLEAIPPVAVGRDPRWRQVAAAGGEPARARGRARVRWTAALGATTAVAAAAIAAVVLATGGGGHHDAPVAPHVAPLHATADLPVYTRPVSDASATRDDAPEVARKNAYFSEARAITTPYGRGYVIPAPGGWTCLIVPDDNNGYGEGCASAEQIAQRGLPVANVTYHHTGVMAAVLPAAAADATLHLDDGTTRPLAVTDGVITAAGTGRSEVTFRIGDRGFTIKLYSDLRCVTGPSYTPEELKRLAAQMGTKVC